MISRSDDDIRIPFCSLITHVTAIRTTSRGPLQQPRRIPVALARLIDLVEPFLFYGRTVV